MNCPCHSGKPYTDCCKSFHDGSLPDTALKLMRSRYAAYALNLPAYIMHTTHPLSPHFSKDAPLWLRHISDFSLHTQFNGLDILDFKESGNKAIVVFTAHLMQGGKDVSFTEKSIFEKVDGKWLYHSGEH